MKPAELADFFPGGRIEFVRPRFAAAPFAGVLLRDWELQ